MIALLAWLAAAAAAQTSRFELAPAQNPAVIGAPLEVSGTAVFPEGLVLEPSLEGQSSEPFEILAVSTGPASAAPGGMVSVPVRLEVAAFQLGEAVLPAFHWRLRSEAGARETLPSPPVRLKVIGPEVPDDADILDIAGPVAIRLWPWLLAALAAAAGAAGWAWRNRRRRAAAEAGPPPDPRTPDEIALDELRRLASAEMPPKDWYARLSDILRLYLERRYGAPALKMTTRDLLRRLARTEAGADARGAVKNLLERCDLVKFARYLPAEEDRRKDVNAAGHVVVLTRIPKPAPAAEAAP